MASSIERKMHTREQCWASDRSKALEILDRWQAISSLCCSDEQGVSAFQGLSRCWSYAYLLLNFAVEGGPDHDLEFRRFICRFSRFLGLSACVLKTFFVSCRVNADKPKIEKWSKLLWARAQGCLYIQLYAQYVKYAKHANCIQYVPTTTLVTADSSWAAASIDIVLLVQYANISLVWREMWAAFPFSSSPLLSPPHRWLGMRRGSGPVARSAFSMAARRSERGPAEWHKAISMFGT